MNDTFLPGSGFDTYESQDKVLMQMDGSTEAAVAVRILQQQGFSVVGAVVRLAPEQAEAAQRAKKAAEALGIECILLNAEALAQQPEAAGAWPQFAALLTAADKLGIQYIGSRRARLEVGTDGVHTVLPPVDAARDDSTALAALPQETLARLLLPLGEFDAGDLAELAQEFQL
jgi:tRNA U34 2-thiouridine synthase MnmA/TrmU